MTDIEIYKFLFYLGIMIGSFFTYYFVIMILSISRFVKDKKLMLMPESFRLDYQLFKLSIGEIKEYNAKKLREENSKKFVESWGKNGL